MSEKPTRTCAVCGRTIQWRKKWERDWHNVRYCSNACRKRGVKDADREIDRAILDLLNQRAADASICPSEAAKRIDPDNWRDRMEDARMSARRLADSGEVVITQKGRPVDPSTAKGPIRIRLNPNTRR